jgi:leucine-rich repeat protein SHOC2
MEQWQFKQIIEQIEQLKQTIEETKLYRYSQLKLNYIQLKYLPDNITSLTHLTELDLGYNQLEYLPETIGNLLNLVELKLRNNRIKRLPDGMANLTKLTTLHLDGNPLIDLSILQYLPSLEIVTISNVRLPRRYWTKINDWKAEWLLDEDNLEIRRTLIEVIGHEQIFQELDAFTIDSWREYTLIEIGNIQNIYDNGEPIGTESMLLLRMICPSTGHVHILRVPPEMVSAEDAIVWVNYGIHPDQFTVQT